MSAERRRSSSVQHVKKYFPIRKGVAPARGRARARRRRRHASSVRRGRDARPRRRVRLRQVDARPLRSSGCSSRPTGDDRLRGPRRSRSSAPARCGRCGARCRWSSRTRTRRLNPRKRVGTIIGDPMQIHRHRRREERSERVEELLETVGLSPEHYNRFPHEFSGGQRQRIGVARALALQPEAGRGRRARLGARRLDPGADAQPARGPPGRASA